jgi:phenylalanyl-tRNA synthetase beta subunit
VLGDSIASSSIKEVFDRYHYTYAQDGEQFTLTVPFWRADITGPHDIAEEIGRVIGYDAIASKPLPFVPSVEANPVDEHIRAVKKYLVNKGFSEVMTYTFRKRGEWHVARGPKDKSALRSTLSDGLKESFDLNRSNMPLLGMREMKLFEIGTVFLADREELRVATCDNGAFEELPLDQFVQKYASESDATDSRLNLPDSTSFKPFSMWSQYPFIVRDVAVWLPVADDAAKRALDEAVRSFAQEAHLRVPELFDSFEKEGRVSYAYRLVFQAHDRTLTDDEVAEMIAPLNARISAIPGAELR